MSTWFGECHSLHRRGFSADIHHHGHLGMPPAGGLFCPIFVPLFFLFAP
ncbi:hypothetical protein LQF76_09865 [Gloeomargaritales cyanobacterium VI4D9]|nr:hypothetical protein LQF76_09865 [Gloeomargaritales cyanobacterium VI4D9]